MIIWNILALGAFFLRISDTAPLPPNSKKVDDSEPIVFFDELNKHDYSQYMNEVLKELQTDKEFLNEIGKNQESYTLDQYAEFLSSASENARNKLDEIKSREIIRLNALEKELKRINSENLEHIPSHQSDKIINSVVDARGSHISSKNHSRFTEKDLKALIARVTHDIEMVDKAAEIQYRRRQFRKRIKERRQIRETKDPEERKKLEEKFSVSKRKRPTYRKVHEPGSEQQLREAWSQQDNLDPQSYDSKTLFKIHDLNQDDHWDIAEVEAFVQTDVTKVSRLNDDSVDQQEQFHETMRMRQHIMDKMDSNRDQLISLEEFLEYEKTSEFKNDQEWQTDEDRISQLYTEEYWQKYHEELSNAIDGNMGVHGEIQKDESISGKL